MAACASLCKLERKHSFYLVARNWIFIPPKVHTVYFIGCLPRDFLPKSFICCKANKTTRRKRRCKMILHCRDAISVQLIKSQPGDCSTRSIVSRGILRGLLLSESVVSKMWYYNYPHRCSRLRQPAKEANDASIVVTAAPPHPPPFPSTPPPSPSSPPPPPPKWVTLLLFGYSYFGLNNILF